MDSRNLIPYYQNYDNSPTSSPEQFLKNIFFFAFLLYVKEVWYFPGIEFNRTLICCKFVENDVFIKFLMTLFTAWCKVTLPGTFRFPCYRLHVQTLSTSTNRGTSSISSTSGTSKLFISPVDAGRHLNIYATSRHRLDVLQNFQIVSRVYWVENFMLF